MVRRRSSSSAKRKGNRAALLNYILILVVAILLVYIAYPSIKVYATGQPFGNRTTGIDSPLTGSQLGMINNAQNIYFESAGEMALNGSLGGNGDSFQLLLSNTPRFTSFVHNGKPSVIYIGAISCVWCGESRWAMALALSRFGSFGALYNGYSAVQDGDVPTLYWTVDNYTANASVSYGNSYTSNYINFFSAEYDSDIKGGFAFPQSQYPIAYFVARAPNQSYYDAMQFMNNTGEFQGTPFTLWGRSIDKGAVGVVFGTAKTGQSKNYPPLTYMTQAQIINQIGSFNTTFGKEEYAAADIYIAQVCSAISNSAPVCSLPAIHGFEARLGIS